MVIFEERNPHEAQIASDTLERYSGSEINLFGSYILLTNFNRYIRTFAQIHQVPIMEGSMFSCAHLPSHDLSIIDFKLGSPAAALIVDLISFLPKLKAALMLGMCGGLRSHYEVGDYFVPVAAIRGEGTSDFYFPPEVPAMGNFLVQKATSEILELRQRQYHIGICHTGNIRFWEFNEPFKEKLVETKAQAYEMECATLFAASYRRNVPLGALLLVSDLPFKRDGIKTKESSKKIFDVYTEEHLTIGLESVQKLGYMIEHKIKGARRKSRNRELADLP